MGAGLGLDTVSRACFNGAMTTTLNLATATPVEIDTELFPLWAARYTQAMRALDYRKAIALAIFPGARRQRGDYAIGASQINDWYQRALECEAEQARIEVRIAELDGEFQRRGGWTRFVLVGGGHLHHYGCFTFKITTKVMLLAQASAMTDEQVVDTFKYTACTHCFPDAPVLPALPDPNACKGVQVALTFKRVERTVQYPMAELVEGEFTITRRGDYRGKCTGCGEVVKVKNNGQPYKHKPVKG